MQHIAEWLEDIGLSEYAQRFAENGIDISRPSAFDGSGSQRNWRSPRASA